MSIEPGKTPNLASVHTENARVAGPGGWTVDVPYAQVDLIDKTPEDPLELWKFDSYQVKVKSGLVQVSDAQATAMVNGMAGGLLKAKGVSDAAVTFKDDQTATFSGRYKLMGLIPMSFSLKFKVGRPTPNAISLTPSGSTRWLLKLAGLDPAKLMPAGQSAVKSGPGGGVVVDLAKLPDFEGQLSGLTLKGGQLSATMGAAKPEAIAAARRDHKTNWAEIKTRGEVRLENGILRNGTAVARDTKSPGTPMLLNFWEKEGLAKRESGDLILDEDLFSRMLTNAAPDFRLAGAKLQGTRLEVTGHYPLSGQGVGAVFGLLFGGMSGMARGAVMGQQAGDSKVNVAFALDFTLTPDGRLMITPVEKKGTAVGDELRKMLAKMPGVVPFKDGFALDLATIASLEATPIKRLGTEPGRLILLGED